MANYRLNEAAKADLIRIHQYGVRSFGEVRADKYYRAFFEQFESIAEQPYLFVAVYFIREGYRRSVCGVDSIYYRIVEDKVEIMRIIRQQDTNNIHFL